MLPGSARLPTYCMTDPSGIYVACLQALLMTSGQQKMAKCYEDAGAGRYKSRASPSVVDAELRAASDKQQKIVAALTASMEQSPDLHSVLERILLRAVAIQQ